MSATSISVFIFDHTDLLASMTIVDNAIDIILHSEFFRIRRLYGIHDIVVCMCYYLSVAIRDESCIVCSYNGHAAIIDHRCIAKGIVLHRSYRHIVCASYDTCVTIDAHLCHTTVMLITEDCGNSFTIYHWRTHEEVNSVRSRPPSIRKMEIREKCLLSSCNQEI